MKEVVEFECWREWPKLKGRVQFVKESERKMIV